MVTATAVQRPSTAQSSPDVIAELRQVTKCFAAHPPCLNGVSLQLRQGEFYFLTGVSGSGKSTLLKLLSGQITPDHGSVHLFGQALTPHDDRAMARLRRRLGVIFQDFKLLGDRTVADNVAFTLLVRGTPKPELQQRVHTALKLVGLTAKASAYPDALSGGEQQRVSIARAIVGGPDLLLADEPTGNLDPQTSQQILYLLHRLHQHGLTVLFTTHDRALTQLLPHPILRLHHGQLQQVATPMANP
ncbi:cell division ATP-binding protein FtsE [Synechococcus sp. PCC 6717]|jgi:cell division transport system ATP-binding protein|nr:cell division ATP-binding protein FtsE [Synechococcus sp. PCC 6717]